MALAPIEAPFRITGFSSSYSRWMIIIYKHGTEPDIHAVFEQRITRDVDVFLQIYLFGRRIRPLYVPLFSGSGMIK